MSPRATQCRSSEALRFGRPGSREAGGTAVERPGDAGDTSADQLVRWAFGGADRHVGVALRQVERLVADDHVEPNVRAWLAEASEHRRQQVDQQRVAGGDAQLARRGRLAPGQLAGEAGDVLVDPAGQATISSPAVVRRVAAAVALEQLRPEASSICPSRRKTVEWFTPSRSAAPAGRALSAIALTRRKSSQARLLKGSSMAICICRGGRSCGHHTG